MVMAHSPLRLFKDFHDKRVLVSGQGKLYDFEELFGLLHYDLCYEF